MPTVVSTGNSPGAESTTCVITAPSSISVGNYLLASVAWAGSTSDSMTITPPTGWTSLKKDTQSNDPSSITQETFYKIADSSDAAASTFTFTADITDTNLGAILNIQNVDTANPIIDSVVGGTATTNQYVDLSSLATTLSTPTTGNFLVLLGVSSGSAGLSTNKFSFSGVGGSPGGITAADLDETTHVEIGTTAGSDSDLSLAITSVPYPNFTIDTARPVWFSGDRDTVASHMLVLRGGISFSVTDSCTVAESYTGFRGLFASITDSISISELVFANGFAGKVWRNLTKVVSSWTKSSKSSTTWSNSNKSSSTWTNQNKTEL